MGSKWCNVYFNVCPGAAVSVRWLKQDISVAKVAGANVRMIWEMRDLSWQ